MVIFFRLNPSFFSIFFNGYPLRPGKISSQRPRNPETRIATVPEWKNRYFLLLFSLLRAGLNGIVDCPGSKSDHVVDPEKKGKKERRQVRELVKRKSFAVVVNAFTS